MPRWLAVLLTLILFAAMSRAVEAGALYRCSANDVRHMTDEGRLGAFPDDRIIRQALGSFVVDTDAGTLRDSSGVRQWRIVQKGDGGNDFVATPSYTERGAVEDYVRVRAWRSQTGVTFFRVGLTAVVTGRCEAVN